jgi:hypothetical protein
VTTVKLGLSRSFMTGMAILHSMASLLLCANSANGQNCVTPPPLSADLNDGLPAAVISLAGVDPLVCPEIPMSSTWSGGRLIFSDSPESPDTTGRLYEDGTLQATDHATHNRVFLYHVNGVEGNRVRFAVVITNLGASDGTLIVHKRGLAGPTANYLYGGKVAFMRWLLARSSSPVTVPAGAAVTLDADLDQITAAPVELVHGIWDYSFDQPHKIAVCVLLVSDDPRTCADLPLLPRDAHQRGTFDHADKVYAMDCGATIDSINDVQQFPIAGNTPNDLDATGTDQTDGSPQVLGGNYGILYRVRLRTQSSDGRNLGFLFNPRGGAWGGAVRASPGITPGGVFLIPASTAAVESNATGAIEGKYAPDPSQATWMLFMPTGGASLPLRVLAVPY